MNSRLNSDLAAERQNYADRQDRMVRQDAGLHPVAVPGGIYLHDSDSNALIGRLDAAGDSTGEPFADEAEAKAAADLVEKVRNFQNS